MTNAFHVDAHGDVRRCTAELRACPHGHHGATVAEAQALFEQTMRDRSTVSRRRPRHPAKLDSFGPDSFYGSQPPRKVQLEALNAVAKALETDDATQLVAACGTGKSYMGRQLLQHEMLKPDANGIAVILTSSIKLATDTASDFRPQDGYDQTMGVYGQDYEVIEVHSAVRRNEDVDRTVLENGVISVERIRQQLQTATEEGKRVVIVSTYDSCARVQEAQALLNDARFEADIVMHDEAHNILGQQRPTTVAADENELTAYTGFHNAIPGAIQTRKRLYATASPVLKEAPGDADEPETLEDAIAIAEKMKAGDQWARVAYYSDNAMVGKVSGFISQDEAIAAGCLAKPEYSVRESRVKGSVKDFQEPVVRADGTLAERAAVKDAHPLTVRTYGAVTATLDALVADAEVGANPATNVLAYVGSIPQAKAFKANFAAVAREEAQGMDATTAAGLAYDKDPVLRRRARMALLADQAEVKAAHSDTDSAAVRERKAAFKMFSGKGVQPGAWTPDKRVLANVDIFSEGVSISEIDAVVIADDEKCSERAMTQAIGRSIRVLPGNDYKTTGHVIVPSVTDGDNVHVTEASVHLAAYGATRVERALVAKKLRGEGVRPDDMTTFKVHNGQNTSMKKARTYAQEAAGELMPLAAAAETHSAHTWLMKNEAGYKEASLNTQAQWIRSRIQEKADRATGDDKARLQGISSHIAGKSGHELREERRNARVVTSALAVGDLSSLSPQLTRKLIRGNVLTTDDAVAEVSTADKRAYVKKHEAIIRYALLTNPQSMSDHHRNLQESLPAQVRSNKKAFADSMRLLRGQGGETDATKALGASFNELMQNDEFVNDAYKLSQERDAKRLPLIATPMWKPVNDDLKAQEAAREAKQHAEAAAGEQTYRVNRAAVRKSGELTSRTLRTLLADDV